MKVTEYVIKAEKGYLEGTVNTAAAMSTLTDQQDKMEKERCIKSSK